MQKIIDEFRFSYSPLPEGVLDYIEYTLWNLKFINKIGSDVHGKSD